MPKKLEVTLKWDGLYANPEPVPKRAGIYLVLAASKLIDGQWNYSSLELLDIGQSGESGVRLDVHDRRDCWLSKKSTNKTIVFSFAVMPSDRYDETDRRIVECCLRSHTKPRCGTECNEGYKREDTVRIRNEGVYTTLNTQYSCESTS